MSDMLDFLAGDAPAPDATPALTPEPAADGPARAANGQFVAAEPVVAPVEEPAPTPLATPAAEPAKPEPGHVPLAAHLDEREKRQAAERRASELEARLQQQPPAEQPDIDPDTANLVLQTRLNLSEEMARDKYTDEVVDAAKAAIIAKFAENPAFQQEVLAKPNPYKFAVEWHKEQQRLEAVKDPTEWEKYQAWKAAGSLAAPPTPQPAAVAPVAPAPATPPRSIASASNAGGALNTSPQGAGVAYDNLFQ